MHVVVMNVGNDDISMILVNACDENFDRWLQ
jgi:hypothetical protein